MNDKVDFISVVIPSLGGDICNTLDSVNSGSVYPNEIIVCLPNDTHSVKDVNKYENLTIIYAQRYGQVYQRIVGFKQAKNDYILQLDDDILLSSKCLEQLLTSLKGLPVSSTISPCWFDNDGKPLYTGRRKGLLSVYYQLINGKKGYVPGGLTLAGTNFGVGPDDIDAGMIKVDWQAGGCVLQRKENLILKDYYPNKGKAYCEDLIHSFLLRESGVDLFIDKRTKCSTSPNPRLSLLKEIIPDFKIRLHLVRLANLSLTRMLIHYIVYTIRSIKFK